MRQLVGTIWKATTHHGPIIRVIGLTPTGRVKICHVTRGNRQHRERIFTISLAHLQRHHERIK